MRAQLVGHRDRRRAVHEDRRPEVPAETRGELRAEVVEVLLEPDDVDGRQALLRPCEMVGVTSIGVSAPFVISSTVSESIFTMWLRSNGARTGSS